MGDHLGKLGVD